MRIPGPNWRGIGFVILVLALWEAFARSGWTSPQFFPPVTVIAAAFWRLLVSLELLTEYAPTLSRTLAGFSAAAVLGVALGLAMGFSRSAYNLMEPLLEMLRPIPPVALIAVSILLLGIDDEMAIFVIAWTCFFPIWLNTLEGALSVEAGLLETARSFRLSRFSTMLKVMLPGSLPGILTGMRISLAFALIVAVVVEMVAGEEGIGRFVIDAESGFRVPEMYAAVFSLALVGFALNWTFVVAERRLLGWHNSAANAEAGV